MRVPDRDAGDPRLAYGPVDLGGRHQVEQGVRGGVVADRGAQVEQVVDGDARRVAEPAEPAGPGRRDPARARRRSSWTRRAARRGCGRARRRRAAPSPVTRPGARRPGRCRSPRRSTGPGPGRSPTGPRRRAHRGAPVSAVRRSCASLRPAGVPQRRAHRAGRPQPLGVVAAITEAGSRGRRVPRERAPAQPQLLRLRRRAEQEVAGAHRLGRGGDQRRGDRDLRGQRARRDGRAAPAGPGRAARRPRAGSRPAGTTAAPGRAAGSSRRSGAGAAGPPAARRRAARTQSAPSGGTATRAARTSRDRSSSARSAGPAARKSRTMPCVAGGRVEQRQPPDRSTSRAPRG